MSRIYFKKNKKGLIFIEAFLRYFSIDFGSFSKIIYLGSFKKTITSSSVYFDATNLDLFRKPKKGKNT